MKIKVINVEVSTQPTKTGKTYQLAEVTFRNLTFQGKTESKKLMSFGAQVDAFKALSSATNGDVFDVEVLKNAQGYNDWIKIARSTEDSTPSTSPGTAGNQSAGGRTSTFETPDERAKKQVYIVRQSSVTSAIAALSVGAKSPVDIDKAIAEAKKIEAFVFGVGSLPKQEAPSFPDEEFPADAE